MSTQPALPVQRTVEIVAWLSVMGGFISLVHTFFVIHYLPAPFVFDVSDTFMDWFNVAYWAHNQGAYSVWQSVYLPLSFVITGLLGDPRCYASHPYDGRDCDWFGIVVIIAMYVGCVIVTAIALYRNDRSTALFRSTAIALGGPLLFAFERGNLIMLAYIAFVVLYGGLVRSKKAVACTAAFLINMKVYLLLPVLTYAVKRKWRLLELCGIAALALYLATLVMVNAGTPTEIAHNLQTWFNMREGTVWDEVLYSTTYKPYLLLDERQYPVRDFVEQRWVDAAKIFITYEVIASRAVAFLCIGWAWFYPRAVSLSRLVFFILMQSFMGQNPGGYAIMFLVFPLFLERKRGFLVGLAICLAYLAIIPCDRSITVIAKVTRDSWLAGRAVDSVYALPLGALIRPGLLMFMLWAVAIDTLVDLHRAVKNERPTVGLAPSNAVPPSTLAVAG
jgi:hypothetical protein